MKRGAAVHPARLKAADLLEAVADRARGVHAPNPRRDDALTVIAAHSQTVEADCDGLKFMLDTRDGGIGRQLFTTGWRPEFDTLAQALELIEQARGPLERSVFVDVGANIGTASLAAVHRFGFARALACEPSPRSRRLLRMSVVSNELEDRVLVAPEAISDEAGEAQFNVVAGSPGRDHLAGRKTGAVTVQTATLDSVLARFGIAAEDVSLLWIDVQGHEPQVLRGARALLDRRCPLVFEFRPSVLRAAGTLATLEEAVAGYGTFIDLRERRPTDLSTVTARLDGLPGHPHTDLLAF